MLSLMTLLIFRFDASFISRPYRHCRLRHFIFDADAAAFTLMKPIAVMPACDALPPHAAIWLRWRLRRCYDDAATLIIRHYSPLPLLR